MNQLYGEGGRIAMKARRPEPARAALGLVVSAPENTLFSTDRQHDNRVVYSHMETKLLSNAILCAPFAAGYFACVTTGGRTIVKPFPAAK
jgi:hypothetical protein